MNWPRWGDALQAGLELFQNPENQIKNAIFVPMRIAKRIANFLRLPNFKKSGSPPKPLEAVDDLPLVGV
jgi:hypothetical protein